MKRNPEYCVIFIDNTVTSINGDVKPNRLAAQKIAAERLINHIIKRAAKSQIGFGALSGSQFGIISSPTSKVDKLIHNLSTISTDKGTKIDIARAIKCSFLAFRYKEPIEATSHIILFIGSQHTLTINNSIELAELTNRNNCVVDIVTFGSTVNNTDVLRNYIFQLKTNSHYLHADTGSCILSDAVLMSPIGYENPEYFGEEEDDDEVNLAIQMSLKDMSDESYSTDQYEEDFNIQVPNHTHSSYPTAIEDQFEEEDLIENDNLKKSIKYRDSFSDDAGFKYGFDDPGDNADPNDPEIAAALDASKMFIRPIPKHTITPWESDPSEEGEEESEEK